MADMIPWDVIPDQRGGTLPTGLYTFELDAVERQMSRNGTLMYKETKHVAEGQFKGHVAYEYHNIGTGKDPLASDPKTWAESIGARTLKGVFTVLDIPRVSDIALMASQAQGKRFMQDVTEKVEPEFVTKNGVQVPNVYIAPDGREISRAGMKNNDYGRRYRAQAAAAAPSSFAASGEESIKSPFTGEMIPATKFAAHMNEYTQRSK